LRRARPDDAEAVRALVEAAFARHVAAVGRGLGRALLAFAEDEARRRGLPEIRLHTNAAMADNLAMYPRLGYAEVGRETRGGFHRVLFAKAL
jgi:GNAT superfamily N-acetyltransferase